MALSIGRKQGVNYTVIQTQTAPSIRDSIESASYFAITIPLYAAYRLVIDSVGIQLGAGPAIRVAHLSVKDLSDIVVDPMLHAHLGNISIGGK